MIRSYKPILVIGAVLTLNACASMKAQNSAKAFGTQAKGATESFESELSSYYSERAKTEKEDALERRVELVLSDECITAIIDPSVRPSLCNFNPVTPSDLPPGLESTNVRVLSTALFGYGTALAALAGDFSEGEAALLENLTTTGASLKALDVAIRSFDDDEGSLEDDEINAFAGVISSIFNAQSEAKREKELLRLIAATDPMVQEATSLLSQSMLALRGIKATQSGNALNQAMQAYSTAIASGGDLEIPYANVEKAVSSHREALRVNDAFAALGQAHAKLREVVQSGFQSEDYQSFIAAIIEVKTSIERFTDTQEEE